MFSSGQGASLLPGLPGTGRSVPERNLRGGSGRNALLFEAGAAQSLLASREGRAGEDGKQHLGSEQALSCPCLLRPFSSSPTLGPHPGCQGDLGRQKLQQGRGVSQGPMEGLASELVGRIQEAGEKTTEPPPGHGNCTGRGSPESPGAQGAQSSNSTGSCGTSLGLTVQAGRERDRNRNSQTLGEAAMAPG